MLAGYEHLPRQGAGSYIAGGRKLGLHTTEGGTAAGAIVALDKNRSWSHFLLSPYEGRKIQFLETNVAGKSMSNVQDGFETNRAYMVQVEIVGYASKSQDWPDWVLNWLADRFNEIRAEFDFPLNYLDFVNGGRLSDREFQDYAGIVGHKHAPDNDHWDPGNLNVPYIVERMKGNSMPEVLNSKVLGINRINSTTASVWGQIVCNQDGLGLFELRVPEWGSTIPNGSPVFRGARADKSGVWPLFGAKVGSAELSIDVDGPMVCVTLTGAPANAIFQLWVPVAKGS